MTEKDKRIFDRLKSDFDYVTSLGYKVLGVFLQGSQNYCLDYEGSDVDTKAIVVPSFEDFVLNKQPASTTLILPSNEHVDVKDIRLMNQCFKKQNINFIEILFSKYRYMNPDYEALYQPMFDNNEKISHYNNYAAVNCIAGMVFEKRKALCHPYEGLKDRIEKYGYCNKQLHHIVRCEEFLRRYIDGVSYEKCLIPTNPQSLIDIKASYIYTLEQALEIADNCVDVVKDVKQNYMDTHPVVIDSEVDEIMNNVLFDVLKHSFREEISE